MQKIFDKIRYSLDIHTYIFIYLFIYTIIYIFIYTIQCLFIFILLNYFKYINNPIKIKTFKHIIYFYQ